MENKTLALAATLSLLFSFAVATESSEEERCQQQFQSQGQLNSCGQYLRDSSSLYGGREWREQFQRCCPQLERMEEQCRCQGIQRIVQQQRQRGELHGREQQEMLKTAESLPGLCRMEPQRCDVGAQAAAVF